MASDLLSSTRVAIFGLGLMGGSLAMALRGKCASLMGIDPDPATLVLARQLNLVDLAFPEPGETLAEAGLVILATPTRTILKLIPGLPELLPNPAVILDLGSTKRQVMQAMDGLPDRFDPVGGHPMCGKEKASLENADPKLYENAPFAFTALERTSRQARELVEQLAAAVGANPLWLDPETHDRWTAATSHLPYLVANALASATPREASPLVGPGFRSTARLAVTPPAMMLDVLVTNRENILAAMRAFKSHLERLESCLSSEDEPALFEQLVQGDQQGRELMGKVAQGDQP